MWRLLVQTLLKLKFLKNKCNLFKKGKGSLSAKGVVEWMCTNCRTIYVFTNEVWISLDPQVGYVCHSMGLVEANHVAPSKVDALQLSDVIVSWVDKGQLCFQQEFRQIISCPHVIVDIVGECFFSVCWERVYWVFINWSCHEELW